MRSNFESQSSQTAWNLCKATGRHSEKKDDRSVMQQQSKQVSNTPQLKQLHVSGIVQRAALGKECVTTGESVLPVLACPWHSFVPRQWHHCCVWHRCAVWMDWKEIETNIPVVHASMTIDCRHCNISSPWSCCSHKKRRPLHQQRRRRKQSSND